MTARKPVVLWLLWVPGALLPGLICRTRSDAYARAWHGERVIRIEVPAAAVPKRRGKR